MNFDYIKEAEPSTDDLRQLYDSLYQNLEKSRGIILDKTTEMGMMLRKATEKKSAGFIMATMKSIFRRVPRWKSISVIQEMMIIMRWSAVF